MMEEEVDDESILLLKSSFFINAFKVTKKQKIIFLLLGSVLLIVGFIGLKTNPKESFHYIALIQMILGIILTVLPFIFSFLDRYFPIPYIKFKRDTIEIKSALFKAPLEIQSREIEKVHVQGSTITIKCKNQPHQPIEIRSPYSKIKQIRERFSSFSEIEMV